LNIKFEKNQHHYHHQMEFPNVIGWILVTNHLQK